jgi:hypothetical protein
MQLLSLIFIFYISIFGLVFWLLLAFKGGAGADTATGGDADNAGQGAGRALGTPLSSSPNAGYVSPCLACRKNIDLLHCYGCIEGDGMASIGSDGVSPDEADRL